MMAFGRELHCIWDGKALLGEGPVYSSRLNGLYWVDIKNCRLHFMDLNSGAEKNWIMPGPIGWILEREKEGLICGLKSGIAFFDTHSAALVPGPDPEPDHPNNRLNDAKIDAHGHIWAGTMDDAETNPTGALYRLDTDLNWEQCDTGYVIANGPAISPDGSVLYHTSSSTREIFAFDLSADGKIDNKRLHIKFVDKWGYPDGMTCDTDGGLWIAHWDGWRISRFLPDGSLALVIDMPVQRPTSLCFGGLDMKTLFVTSASIGLSENELEDQPLAGGIFALEPGFVGVKNALFKG